MTIVIITIIIIVIVLCLILKTKRKVISVLIGFVVSVLWFIAYILTLIISPYALFFILLSVSYIAIIAFLVLWNSTTSKKAYFILCTLPLCAAVWAGILKYHDYVETIPVVSEDSQEYWHTPFLEGNKLAELAEESTFLINDNFPILDGATALYPVYAAFAQAVYLEAGFSIMQLLCSRTSRAYDNLLEGKVDLIFCAGPSKAQLQQFSDAGIDIKLTAIGREAFVFFVNKNNTVNGLTTEDIRGIYSGRIKNWKKLNGPNKGIRAFQRPENSGSQTMLENIMGGIPLEKPRKENIPAGMGGMINRVARYRNFSNAIGFSFLYFSTEMVKNDQIKLLSIDGVYPSKETIQDGTYPFSEDFYAIYIDTEEKNENIEPFIEWILGGQGQELIQKTGYQRIK